MKWFKHYSDASEGLSLKTLWSNKDYEAIAVFWRICELLSTHDSKDGILTTNWSFLARETGMKPSKCRRVLARISAVSLLSFQHDTDEIQKFLVPKWSEFQETRGKKRSKKNEIVPGEERGYINIENKKKRENKKKPNTPSPDLLTLWNTNSGGLPKISGVGRERQKKWSVRWHSKPDEQYWVEVITKLSKSSFCNGSKDWVATVDWILKNDTNHQKVFEGNYDDDRQFNQPVKYVWTEEKKNE